MIPSVALLVLVGLGWSCLLFEQTRVLYCSVALLLYQTQLTMRAFPLFLCALLACLKRRSGGLEFGV